MATPKRKIYVASSWRNTFQPMAVHVLRTVENFEVYDFRHPRPGERGFAWSDIDGEWLRWTPDRYIEALEDPVAVAGFNSDLDAMKWADTFVLVMPAGRSAHLELGWAAGAGKETVILLDEEGFEPELMYKLADHVVTTMSDVLDVLWVSDEEDEL